MKQIALALLLISTIGCTTSPNDANNVKPSSYSCVCNYTYLGRDTVVIHAYYGVTSDEAEQMCQREDKTVKSFTKTGSCGL